MLEKIFNYFRYLIYIPLSFQWLTSNDISGNTACRSVSAENQVCISTKNGKVSAIETIPQGRLSPVQSFYFYPDGQFLAHVNWQEAFSILFSEEGSLEEILYQEDFKAFRAEKEIIDCNKGRCISQIHKLTSIPTTELETGDIIFSGDLSPYSGLRGGELTHVSIYAGQRNNKHYIVTNDIYEFAGFEPLDVALQNTYAYTIIRNRKFSAEFEKYLEGKKPHLRKRFPFCSLLIFSLYQDAFNRKGSQWPYFQRIFPEYLLRNILDDFQVVAFYSQHHASAAKMLQARHDELQAIHANWVEIVSDPGRALHRMFLNRFPILPVEFESDKVENLIRLATSGLFNASLEFTAKKIKTHTRIKKSPEQKKSPRKGFQKYQIQNSPRIHRLDYDTGETRLIEIYREGGDCPDLAIYMDRGGRLSHLINWKEKYYFSFDENNNLSESLVNAEYRFFRQNEMITRCLKDQCQSKDFEFLPLPKTNLQIGDIIFSANLFPYSGRGLSEITHIEIVSGFKNSSPIVLTNDISAPLQNLPLESVSTNRFAFIIARNNDFTKAFRGIIENLEDLQAVPLPYFCTNLYVELYSKLYPEKTRKWDQVDRNSAEQIFLNTIRDFQLIETNLGKFKKLEDLIEQRRPAMLALREQINSIMSHPETFLEQLFRTDFHMLPIIFDQRKVHQIIQMMKIQHPWRLSYPENKSKD